MEETHTLKKSGLTSSDAALGRFILYAILPVTKLCDLPFEGCVITA